MKKIFKWLLSERRPTKTGWISRLCAIAVVLVLCVIFVRRVPALYEVKFNQIKKSIESYFSMPSMTMEEYLKQLYGGYMLITNRSYVNGNFILNDGRLVREQMSAPPLLEERAAVIIQLKEYLYEKDIPFLFLRAPDPMRDNSQMPKGFENTVIEDGAYFLSILRESGVDVLDLREEMTNDYTDWSEVFYWGDHHWNAEGALWAWGKVGSLMNSEYGFSLEEKTWNPQEYEHITFARAFVGSASAQIAGTKEDIAALIPKFPTNFEVANKSLGNGSGEETEILASGNFLDVFIPAAKEENNNSFAYGNLNAYRRGQIKQSVNFMAGEHKKVLLLSDSFGSVLVTYLATAVENVDYLYLDVAENPKLFPMLENESYDLVLFLLYDGTILYGGDNIEKDIVYFGEVPVSIGTPQH